MSNSNSESKPVNIRPLADADIDRHIAYTIDNRSLNAAQKLLDSLEKAFSRIGEQPGIGPARYAHLPHCENLRMWPVPGEKYLVFYIERPEYIDVLRVLHGSQDISTILTGEIQVVDHLENRQARLGKPCRLLHPGQEQFDEALLVHLLPFVHYGPAYAQYLAGALVDNQAFLVVADLGAARAADVLFLGNAGVAVVNRSTHQAPSKR